VAIAEAPRLSQVSSEHVRVKIVMQVAISIVGLVLGVIVLMGKHDPETKHAASGWVGAVVGYWLR
jgi:hypothetical protein